MVEVSATLDTADRAREADDPRSLVVKFGADKPLRLDAGVELAPFQIAYQTYGALNPQRSNARGERPVSISATQFTNQGWSRKSTGSVR